MIAAVIAVLTRALVEEDGVGLRRPEREPAAERLGSHMGDRPQRAMHPHHQDARQSDSAAKPF